jgi:hypothetical protein
VATPPDANYVTARTVLLDALEGLGTHRQAAVLVGAQAVYEHTRAIDAEIALSPSTLDADIALVPELLVDDQPSIVDAMEGTGFHTTDQRGIYRKNTATAQVGQVDLLVPRSVGGRRGRGADLGPHGRYAAMQVHGLEGALVSHMPIAIRSLEKDDPRGFDIRVAGPGALLVAKMHKIAERHSGNRRDRLDNKDAFDVYRILRAVESDPLAREFHAMLDDPTAREVVAEAGVMFGEYFGSESAVGTRMVGQYVEGLEDPQFFIASSVALSVDLLRLVS